MSGHDGLVRLKSAYVGVSNWVCLCTYTWNSWKRFLRVLVCWARLAWERSRGLDSNAQFLILGMATVGSTGQFLAPMVGHQALGGSAGSGTGAVLGALLGSFVLIPGFYWVTALVGAFIGGLMGARRQSFEA